MGHAYKFSNRMDVEEAIVAYFKILPEYLLGGTGENNEISVRIAGVSVCVQRGSSCKNVYQNIWGMLYPIKLWFLKFSCDVE
jgi:hypothetical protein